MPLPRPATVLIGLALAASGAQAPSPAPSPSPAPPRSAAKAAPKDRAPADKAAAGAPAKAEEAPAGDPRDRALREAEAGRVAEATAIIDAFVEAHPDDRRGLLVQAQVAMVQASRLGRPESNPYHEKAVGVMRRLAGAHKDLTPQERLTLGTALYNEACGLSVRGQKDEALAVLEEALSSGFDAAELLAVDPELDAIRPSPKFEELKGAAEARQRVEILAQVRTLLAASKPFPFEFRLPGVDGKEVSSADLKGKVAVVNIWGTWCPPCRRMASRLVPLLEAQRERGLAVVGINYERVPAAEVKETVAEYLAKEKISYPCAIGDAATRGKIPGFKGFPTTLFLDRAGAVRLAVQGEITPLRLEAIATALLSEDRTPADAPGPRRTPEPGRPARSKPQPARP